MQSEIPLYRPKPPTQARRLIQRRLLPATHPQHADRMGDDDDDPVPWSLPDDVVQDDVLRCLPQRALAVCRSVCKAWRDGIDSRCMLRPVGGSTKARGPPPGSRLPACSACASLAAGDFSLKRRGSTGHEPRSFHHTERADRAMSQDRFSQRRRDKSSRLKGNDVFLDMAGYYVLALAKGRLNGPVTAPLPVLSCERREASACLWPAQGRISCLRAGEEGAAPVGPFWSCGWRMAAASAYSLRRKDRSERIFLIAGPYQRWTPALESAQAGATMGRAQPPDDKNAPLTPIRIGGGLVGSRARWPYVIATEGYKRSPPEGIVKDEIL